MVKVRLFGLCCLLGFVVSPGVSQECEWDPSVEENQGLHPDAHGVHLALLTELQDPESCRRECCARADCHLALLGFPQDGGPECMLVQCLEQGEGVCRLQNSTQFNVYRKMVEAQTTVPERNVTSVPRVVPHQAESLEPTSNGTNNDRCRLPKRVGPCRAAFAKFFYDVTNQTCQKFIYGGCAPNDNNFNTKEDCEAACSGVTGSVLPHKSTTAPKNARRAPVQDTDAVDFVSEAKTEDDVPAQETASRPEVSAEEFAERCEAERKAGPCRASFLHWYHDKNTRTCQSFIYGGCQGNKNNYESKESCLAACAAVTVLPSSRKGPFSKDYKEHCIAASDTGPCRAAFPMFYYDPNTRTCQSFLYGGCSGNLNRYNTAEECMARCNDEGHFDGRGKARSRWTAAVFLFTTLAVISALLLGALVLIALRRNKLYRRPSSVSDKEELLTDPDERSSVESLSLPESPKVNKA